MATKTFHLEIRFSTNDENNFETVKEVMKKTARDLYAITSVAKGDGGAAPAINLYAEDFIVGKEEINVSAAGNTAVVLAAAKQVLDDAPVENSLGDEVL